MSFTGVDYEITLEQNAWDSLRHGLHHFVDDPDDRNLKYAIIHTFHAVELFFKARLAKDNPSLIFRDSEGPNSDDSYTIGAKELVKRLSSIRVNLSDEEARDVEGLRRVRNSLEHNRVSVNYKEVVFYVGRVMKLLEQFVELEMGENIENYLSRSEYQKLQKAKDEFELELRVATHFIEQKAEEHTIILDCLNCDNSTVMVPDPRFEDDGMPIHAQCLIESCGYYFLIGDCAKCGESLLLSSRDAEEPFFHDYCWEYIMRE